MRKSQDVLVDAATSLPATRSGNDRVESGSSPPTAALEAQIQAEVAAWQDSIGSAVKHRQTSLQHARAAGKLLLKLKDSVEHGEWLPTLARCGLHPRRAQKFMRLASKCESDSHFTTVREAESALATSKWQRANGGLPNAKDDWETPLDLYKELDAEFHFELGPASNGKNAKTPRFFTEKEDGLAQPWAPARVFLNPPYSCIGKWLQKAHQESQRGALVVCLIKVDTTARWWQTYVCTGFGGTQKLIADEVRFLPGRAKFTHPNVNPKNNNGAPWGAAVVVYRPKETV